MVVLHFELSGTVRISQTRFFPLKLFSQDLLDKFQRSGGNLLCDTLLHTLFRGKAEQFFHRTADIGGFQVHVHRPDSVFCVLSEQTEVFLAFPKGFFGFLSPSDINKALQTVYAPLEHHVRRRLDNLTLSASGRQQEAFRTIREIPGIRNGTLSHFHGTDVLMVYGADDFFSGHPDHADRGGIDVNNDVIFRVRD